VTQPSNRRNVFLLIFTLILAVGLILLNLSLYKIKKNIQQSAEEINATLTAVEEIIEARINARTKELEEFEIVVEEVLAEFDKIDEQIQQLLINEFFNKFTVVKDDTVWSLLGTRFEELDLFEGLNERGRNYFTWLFVNVLYDFPPDALVSLGFSSGSIDLIYPGEYLDLNVVFSDIKYLENLHSFLLEFDKWTERSLPQRTGGGYKTSYRIWF